MRRARLDVFPFGDRVADYERVVLACTSSASTEQFHIALAQSRLPSKAGEAGRHAVVSSVHDYYCLCPTTKLIDGGGTFCGGDCSGRQYAAGPRLWPEGAFPELRDRWAAHGEVWPMEQVDQLVTTSGSVVDRFVQVFGADMAERFEVVPHGRDFGTMGVLAATAGPRETGSGQHRPARGRGRSSRRSPKPDQGKTIEFHVLGKTILGEQPGRSVIHGAYKREAFFDRVAIDGRMSGPSCRSGTRRGATR